ncbi:hypothetical protein [Flavobacterium sp.]|uniref:hypothetical protein n=1 Tax=Flavobacterium sp. TaxID=239 RepID=UPI003BEC8B62
MKYLLLLTVIFFQVSCVSDSISNNSITPVATNKVLLLKVNFENNAFEGGHEAVFPNSTSTFTVTNQFVPPSDFGNIKLFYNELNAKLFDGDIIWMGDGQIHFPTSFLPASQYNYINTLVPIPDPLFENIYNPNNTNYNYSQIFDSIRYLGIVNEYRGSNPNASVKLFLYTPGVGVGDPTKWKWIFIIKN